MNCFQRKLFINVFYQCLKISDYDLQNWQHKYIHDCLFKTLISKKKQLTRKLFWDAFLFFELSIDSILVL